MRPPDVARRPQGDHPETGDMLTTSPATSLPTHNIWGVRLIWPTPSDARPELIGSVDGCRECGGRLGTPKPGRSVCRPCHLENLAGLRRRRGAESRVQPLSDWGWAS